MRQGGGLPAATCDMGMCYSLRPRLFSDPSGSGGCSGPDAELRPGVGAEQPHQGDTAARLRSADGLGLQLRRRETDDWQPQQNGAEGERAPPPQGSKGPDRDKVDKPQPQDIEADREAKRVSKCIDKMLKQQKREYKQTHRLLLLGKVSIATCLSGKDVGGRPHLVCSPQICANCTFKFFMQFPTTTVGLLVFQFCSPLFLCTVKLKRVQRFTRMLPGHEGMSYM